MVRPAARLDPVFHALADPTRRAVVERLAQGPATVSDLARPFAMALPSFVQHLRVLEDGGLIRSTKVGRVRTCRLARNAMEGAGHWLDRQRAIWNQRLNQLDDHLHTLHREEQLHDRQP